MNQITNKETINLSITDILSIAERNPNGLMIRPPPRDTLFAYTTPFRSDWLLGCRQVPTRLTAA